MWKIAVCDDEKSICDEISGEIRDYAERSGESFDVSFYYSGEELIKGIAEDTDILFLDIKMDGISGLDTAREIRAKGMNTLIIFITTMTQYAMEGYEVHAFGFISKPVERSQFSRFTEDALALLRKNKDRFINFQRGGSVVRVSTRELVYAEVYRHEVRVVTAGATIISNMPLKDVEEMLTGDDFFRPHKSYLVNLRHIRSYDKDSMIMSNGDRVPLSKHRRSDFIAAFSRFAGGMTV